MSTANHCRGAYQTAILVLMHVIAAGVIVGMLTASARPLVRSVR